VNNRNDQHPIALVKIHDAIGKYGRRDGTTCPANVNRERVRSVTDSAKQLEHIAQKSFAGYDASLGIPFNGIREL
jgi:hypothetical protein